MSDLGNPFKGGFPHWSLMWMNKKSPAMRGKLYIE